MFTSLVGGKTLERSDVAPVLEKFRDSLIGKNVAAEIATKLCASVETKLIGKVSLTLLVHCSLNMDVLSLRLEYSPNI